MSEWIPSCKQLGGPVNVDMDRCLRQDFGCEAFKRGLCIFDQDSIMFNIEGNITPENCQVFFHDYL